MKELRDPQLDERAVTATLSNGLPVCVVPKPGFAKKCAYFVTNYGSIDTKFTWMGREYDTPAGVAHYLEHKMFEMPDRDVMQEFSALGANPNAFTSYAMTAYYFTCTEQFEACLELLLTFVSTPYFTAESVERERGIIGQEIRMYEDSADSRVYEDLFAAMYRHHPVRVPIAGTVESIPSGTTARRKRPVAPRPAPAGRWMWPCPPSSWASPAHGLASAPQAPGRSWWEIWRRRRSWESPPGCTWSCIRRGSSTHPLPPGMRTCLALPSLAAAETAAIRRPSGTPSARKPAVWGPRAWRTNCSAG